MLANLTVVSLINILKKLQTQKKFDDFIKYYLHIFEFISEKKCKQTFFTAGCVVSEQIVGIEAATNEAKMEEDKEEVVKEEPNIESVGV